MKMPTEAQLDGVQRNRGYAAYWKTPQPLNPWPEGCRNFDMWQQGFFEAEAYAHARRSEEQIQRLDREQRTAMAKDIKAAKQARHKANKAARADDNRARQNRK